VKNIIVIITVILLGGCAEKSRFDCPYGQGPTCASMDTIDKMIKNGNLTKKQDGACNKKPCNNLQISKNTKTNIIIQQEHFDEKSPIRVPEEVMQLWIAPYETANGIYYNCAYVSIIVKEATWRAPTFDDVSHREDYNG